MITLNTYAGEWPATNDHARAIVHSALGNLPGRSALSGVSPGKNPVKEPERRVSAVVVELHDREFGSCAGLRCG